MGKKAEESKGTDLPEEGPVSASRFSARRNVGRETRAISRVLVAALAAGCALGSAAGEPCGTRLDERGPYLILTTTAAVKDYGEAIRAARKIHPGAAEGVFDPADGFAQAREALKSFRPRYALVFLLPGELDARVGWEWLRACAEVDADPFVDVRSGFVTGASPAEAAAFMGRIASAAKGESKLPPVFADVGPIAMAPAGAVYRRKGSMWLPAYARRFEAIDISHAAGALDDPAKAGLGGAGIVHFGGHGFPDGVVDGIKAKDAAGLGLAPCVVFNGACYSGVTSHWFDDANGEGVVRELIVAPAESFALQMLRTPAVGYLAALHPDHGIPVYQEMEILACTGGSLGDAIKSTYDGIVLASGGRLPAFERLENGKPSPEWTPSEMMRKGTASRVLFGDPALIPFEAFAKAPLEMSCTAEGKALRISAKVVNPGLVNLFVDTYHADLSSDEKLFNTRALVTVRLPKDWEAISSIEWGRVEVPQSFLEGITGRAVPAIRHRIVGFAVEEEGGERLLRVQVDLSSTGYRKSPFLREGSVLELVATR